MFVVVDIVPKPVMRELVRVVFFGSWDKDTAGEHHWSLGGRVATSRLTSNLNRGAKNRQKILDVLPVFPAGSVLNLQRLSGEHGQERNSRIV